MYKTKVARSLIIGVTIFIGSIIQAGAMNTITNISNYSPARSFDLIKNQTSPIIPSEVEQEINQESCGSNPISCPANYTCQSITYKKIGSTNNTTIQGCVHQGFDQPTFNKYLYNLNIPGARKTDEQQFLIGRICTGGNCETTPKTYYNTVPNQNGLQGIKKGDAVRFSLYVHNNGKDGVSPDATNVQVGIELDNKLSSTPDKWLNPKGFIKSDNAQYTSVYDDMQLGFDKYGLILKPKTWALISNQIGGDKTFTSTSANSVKLGDKTVTVTPTFDNAEKKMWLTFNKFPGCFPYSSFVYFEATAEENTCELITATQAETSFTKDGKKLYKLDVPTVQFKETGASKPTEVQYKWTTSGTGKFYLTTASTTGISTTKTTSSKTIYYTGTDPVNVELVHIKPNDSTATNTEAPYLNVPACKKSFTFPAYCTKLDSGSVTSEYVQIGTQTVYLHTLQTANFSTSNSEFLPFTAGIHWTTSNPAGKFYKQESNGTYTLKGNSSITSLGGKAYYSGTFTDVLTAKLVKTNTAYSSVLITSAQELSQLNQSVCTATFTIPAEPAVGYCTKLDAESVPSEYVQIGTQTVYLHTLQTKGFTTSNSEFLPFTAGIHWTTSNPAGKFYKQESNGTYTYKGISAITNLSGKTYYSGAFTDVITAKLIKTNAEYNSVLTPSTQELSQLNQSVCTATFTIPVEPPGICSNLDVTHSNNDNVLATIDEKTVTVHKFQYNGLYFTNGQNPNPSTLGLKWGSNDPDGRFYKYLSGKYVKISNLNPIILSPPATVYYVGAGTVTVHPVNQLWQEDPSLNTPGCNKSFPTEDIPQDFTCQNLKILISEMDSGDIFDPNPILIQNKIYKIATIANFDIAPENAKIKYTATKGIYSTNDNQLIALLETNAGELTMEKATTMGLFPQAPLIVENSKHIYFLPFSNQEGENAIKMEAVDFEEECTAKLSLAEIPKKPTVCESIFLSVKDSSGNLVAEDLKQSTIYEITALAIYNNSQPESKNRFVPGKGLFSPTKILFDPIIALGGITKEEAVDPNHPLYVLLQKMQNPQAIPNGQSMYFFAFSDQEGPNAFRVEAVGYENPCNASKGLLDIPEEPTVCESMILSVKDNAGNPVAGDLKQSEIYKITALATYNKSQPNAQNRFVPTKGLLSGNTIILNPLIALGGITKAEATNPAHPLYALTKTQIIPNGQPRYFFAFSDQEGPDAFRVEAVGYENPCNASKGLLDIPEEPTVCESMMIRVKDNAGNPVAGDLKQSTIYEIRAMANYNKPQPSAQNRFVPAKGFFSPNTTILNSLITLGGITKAESDNPNHPLYELLQKMQTPQIIPNSQSMYFLAFSDQEGPDAFRVEAVGYENPCNASKGLLDIPEEPTVCESMMIRVKDNAGNPVAGDLKQSTIYEIRAMATYNKPQPSAQNRFVPTKGLFSPAKILLFWASMSEITKAEANDPTHPSYELLQKMQTPQIITNSQSMYFLAFSDQEGPDAFRVEAVGYENPCNASKGLLDIPEEQIICESIEVTEIVNGRPIIRQAGYDFEPGVYQLRAELTYNPEMEELITFSSKQGVFFVGMPTNPTPEITVPEGATVYMIIPDNATNEQNSITVKAATNDPNNVCITKFDIFVEPLEEEACQDIDVDVDRNDNSVTYTLEDSSDLGNFTGTFRFTSSCNSGEFENDSNDENFSINKFRNGITYDGIDNCRNTTIQIKAVGDLSGGTNCDKTYEYRSGGGGGGNNPNPEIEKCIINPYNTSSCKESLTYGYGEKTQFYSKATYKVTFYPDGVKEATIIEPTKIKSNIPGKSFNLSGVAIFYDDKTHCDDGLWITNRDRLKKVNSKLKINSRAESCMSKYNTNKKDFGKIELEDLKNIDKVTIFYEYKNNAKPDTTTCLSLKQGDDCSIKLENTVEFETKDDDGKDKVVVSIPCPAIITRESGDVFFHTPINTSNNLACYKLDSTTGLILRPTPETPQRGPITGNPSSTQTTDPITWQSPDHDICKMSLAELQALDTNLAENALKNFSSSVCSMKAEVATQWKEKFINEAIQANVTKLTRQIPEKQWTNGVYYTKDNYEINQELKIKAEQNSSIPAARTYIIENADLIINNNIIYEDSTIHTLTNPKSIPSAAFIVINGNIQIDPKVTRLDGVFVAIDTQSGKNGKIQPVDREDKGESYALLTIRGSLVGNVYDLFMSRKGSGNPFQNEGSIVIKYDQRIILNTPPGLTDLLDIAQLRVAN